MENGKIIFSALLSQLTNKEIARIIKKLGLEDAFDRAYNEHFDKMHPKIYQNQKVDAALQERGLASWEKEALCDQYVYISEEEKTLSALLHNVGQEIGLLT